MTGTDDPCARWLAQAQIAADRLSAEQRGLLQAAFAFRQRCGDDYYSSRLLSHFLLHCDSGLKVAQIARLVGISRPTASHQQGLSSREAIQAAHHRLAGRPHGKLLPRYAGPIAEFILTHGDATRYDVQLAGDGAVEARGGGAEGAGGREVGGLRTNDPAEAGTTNERTTSRRPRPGS